LEQHLFVVGLDEANLVLLEGLQDAERTRYVPALDFEEIRGVEEFDVDGLLRLAKERMDAHPGRVDGVCTFLDFPATDLVPLLAAHAGVPGPSLEAVLRCDHKYWSRLVQAEVAPEAVPRIALFDPFDPSSMEAIDLPYPFWVKPLNAYRSHLGFLVTDAQDLRAAADELRHALPRLSGPLQAVLAHAEVPENVRRLPEHAVLAEELLTGRLCTIEGYVTGGHPHAYAVVDSVREPGSSSFARYEYPSTLPHRMQAGLCALAERVVGATGLDASPFNVEVFVDAERGQFGLLEINARLSQSHAPLFELVDGTTHLKIMVDIALGRPVSLPRRQGPYAVAAKFFLRAHHDGVVRRVPDAERVRRIEREVPGAIVHVLVDEGTRLSELEDQDAYSYELVEVYLGAADQPELMQRWERCQQLLEIDLGPAPGS
jgi:biotin carboxylase